MVDGQSELWRIVVPTRDSARWVGAVARHYRCAGLDPLFVYDARSRDATLDILRNEGFAPSIYDGSGADIVEGGIMAFGVQACASPWVLRMDDDEFPSAGLVAFLCSLDPRSGADAYFVSRRELFRAGGALYYSRCRYRYFCHGYGDVLNPQLRLFRPSRARFITKLHSPGLEIDGETALAPGVAFYAHLTFLIRDAAERLEKVRGYDALEPGLGWFFADEYLPELTSLAGHRARQDGLAEFADLIAALPRPAEGPPPSLSPEEAARFSAALARKWRLYYEERGGSPGESGTASASPVGGYGPSPPPTLVVAPQRYLPLAADFGEFDFCAHDDAAGWRPALAGGEHEWVWLWGAAAPETVSAWLRAVARHPLDKADAAGIATDARGGLLRMGRATPTWRLRLAAGLAALPAIAAPAIAALLRPPPLRL